MNNMFGRLPPMPSLLSTTENAAMTQQSQTPAATSAPSPALPAASPHPPFSAPPRPLYVQRPSQEAASVLAARCPSRPARPANSLANDGASSVQDAPSTLGEVLKTNTGAQDLDAVFENPTGGSTVVRTNHLDNGFPSGGGMLYLSGKGAPQDSGDASRAGTRDEPIDLDGESSAGRPSAPPPPPDSSSDVSSAAAPRGIRRRKRSKKVKGGVTSSKKRKTVASAAAGKDNDFKDRGVWADKYRLLVLQWWCQFNVMQLGKDGANKQLSIPNAAVWVVECLAKKKNNPLKPLKYDAVHYLMDTVRVYMAERAKTKAHSTGLSPADILAAEKEIDARKAVDWRLTTVEMAGLVEVAAGGLKNTGSTCKTMPVTHVRAPTRGAHAAGVPDTSKPLDDKSASDSNASAADKSGTPCLSSSSSSSISVGGVLPPSIRSGAKSSTPLAPPAALPTARRGGASDRTRRSLTADEDGRAALGEDGAIQAIVESTRSAASARAAQAFVAMQTLEMQAAAAARAAEATLAAIERQFELDVMRERRESRESERRGRTSEQQAAAAVMTAQSAVPLETLKVLKELFLAKRDPTVLRAIAPMPVMVEAGCAGSASGGVGLSVAGDGEEAAGVSSALPTTGVLGGGCTRSRPGGGVNANPPPSVASDGDLSAHLGGGVAADNGGVHGGSGGEVDGVEQSRDGQARE